MLYRVYVMKHRSADKAPLSGERRAAAPVATSSALLADLGVFTYSHLLVMELSLLLIPISGSLFNKRIANKHSINKHLRCSLHGDGIFLINKM